MPTIVIRDKQTGQEFEGPTGTPFDETKYQLVGSKGYAGEPDKPIESRLLGIPGVPDIPDKAAAAALRYGGPAVGAMVGGPGGLLGRLAPAVARLSAGLPGSLAAAGAVGAASTSAADVAEGKGFDTGRAAFGGAANMLPAVAARPLGALAGVAKAKLGGSRLTGDLDLSALQGMAGQAENVKGLVGARSGAAAETIKELLDASGGKLPINAPGLQPSAELVRKGIPFRQPGGKEMYGALRGAAKEQRPDYDRLLQQFRSSHALLDPVRLRELLAGGMLGGGGGMQMGWPGVLAALLPRLVNSSRFAPAAPEIQAGLSGLSSGLTGQ
jgi:hypothetical protein